MRGGNEAEVAKWVNLLEKNAKTAALFSMALSPKQSQSGQSQSLISHLSPEQRKRYQVRKDKNGYSTLTRSILTSRASLSGTSVPTLYPPSFSMHSI